MHAVKIIVCGSSISVSIVVVGGLRRRMIVEREHVKTRVGITKSYASGLVVWPIAEQHRSRFGTRVLEVARFGIVFGVTCKAPIQFVVRSRFSRI